MDSPLERSGVVSDIRRPEMCCWSDKPRAKVVAAFALVLLGLISTSPVWAKEKKPLTKTVTGFVLDEAEKPIEGASVELTDAQTSKVIAIYSQEDGSYHFDDLSFSHDYKIKASFKGSSSETRRISSMDMRARLVMNLTLSAQKTQ